MNNSEGRGRYGPLWGLPLGRSRGGKAAARTTAMLVLVVTALAAPIGAAAQLYRWTDGEGITRYTNDPAAIPPDHRATARDIGSPQSRPEAPPSAVGSTVLSFTPGAPITAAVHLNGTPLTLVLDTGADRTVLSPAAVARAGFDAEGGRAVEIVGATGRAAAREVMIPRLDVAGARVGPLAIIVHNVGVVGVDGLLGRDVLDYFTLTVDTAAGRATLTPR